MANGKKKKHKVVSSRPVLDVEKPSVVVSAAKLTEQQKKTRAENRKNKAKKAQGGFNTGKKKKFDLPKKETKTPDLVSKSKKEVSGAQKRANRRKSRYIKKRNTLRDKAARYSEGDKKRARLQKRAKRKDERAAGTRKTAVGTALKSIGRGAQAVGHAYAYGHTGRLKGNKVSSKKQKTGGSGNFSKYTNFKKPSAVELTPLSGTFRALGKAKDRETNK